MAGPVASCFYMYNVYNKKKKKREIGIRNPVKMKTGFHGNRQTWLSRFRESLYLSRFSGISAGFPKLRILLGFLRISHKISVSRNFLLSGYPVFFKLPGFLKFSNFPGFPPIFYKPRSS